MKSFQSYIWIAVGVVLVALGLSLFLIPANLATGGITGLAMVIHAVFPAISIGNALVVLNTLLFIIGFVTIGKNFGTKTIFATVLLTGTMYIFDWFQFVKEPLVDDLLANLIVGIIISGIGLGIVFNENASTGGTDIIAKILNKYLHIEIGKSLQIADMVVVTLAAMSFGIELAIYALLGIFLNGIVIDTIIEGFNSKISVSIISQHSEDIQKFIVHDIERGATIYTAKGAYTKENKEIINSVMNKKEFVQLKNYVKETDPHAFIMTSNVREVLGEGFLR